MTRMAIRIPFLKKIRTFFVGVLAVVGMQASFAAASQTEAEAQVSAPEETLEVFVRREMQEKMEEFNIAGATVALVRNGEVFYKEGFGDADREQGVKVDVDHTLFRWGSISKTFTWTAIMQLVEQGKIMLDADVNDYLIDVKVPEAFDRPITVRDILAHTSGFEDAGLGHLFERSPADRTLLKEYLIKYQPQRVRPAGVVFAYSNYASALAGQIIANVSGQSFEDYMDTHIFRPLGMNDTTFREPTLDGLAGGMDPKLQARVSKGFAAKGDEPQQDNDFIFMGGVAPAGAISSTASDMAKFAIAHLSGCEFDGVRLLTPETCSLMHSPLLPLNAGHAVNNYHGFFQHRQIGGHNRVGHNGGAIYFHSQMGLYPEFDFAFLISTNTNTGPQLYTHMEKAIVTRLFGDKTEKPEPIEPAADMAKRAHKYVGHYQMTRRNYTSIEVLYSLFQGSVRVTTDEEGYLIFHLGEEAIKAAEVKPNLFRAVDKLEYFEFVENETGDVVYLKAAASFEKVSWHQAPENRLMLLMITFLFMIVGAIVFMVRSLGRFSNSDALVVKQARRRVLAALTLWISFIVLLAIAIVSLISSNEILTDFPSNLTVIALTLGIMASLVSLAPTWSVVSLWYERAWSGFWRVYYSLLVLSVWAFLLQLDAIHLIGFNYIS